jgi:hypothetical protein
MRGYGTKEAGVHGRVNIIFGERDKVDDGVAHLEESDRAVVEATVGNEGLTTMVDREAGVIVAVSYWDELPHSSEAALTRARQGAAAAAGGDVIAETYEVVAHERLSAPDQGAAVRMWQVQIEPARVADGTAFVRDELLPQLRASTGFCHADLLLDQGLGSGALLTAWSGEDAAADADAELERARDRAAEQAGTKFPRTEKYSLVRMSG